MKLAGKDKSPYNAGNSCTYKAKFGDASATDICGNTTIP